MWYIGLIEDHSGLTRILPAGFSGEEAVSNTVAYLDKIGSLWPFEDEWTSRSGEVSVMLEMGSIIGTSEGVYRVCDWTDGYDWPATVTIQSGDPEAGSSTFVYHNISCFDEVCEIFDRFKVDRFLQAHIYKRIYHKNYGLADVSDNMPVATCPNTGFQPSPYH